jgi:rhodanese-related sulfurtransferase
MTQNVEPTTAYKNIYVDSNYELNDKIVLLDVRTPEEYTEGHAPMSINIDHTEVIFDAKKIAKKFKDKRVYVICHSGVRSELVTNYLSAEKVNTINILGGMDEWESKGLPVVK